MNWPFLRNRDRLRDLQTVRLLGQYTAPEGILRPGALGTIVYRHPETDAYEVEFAEPFPTVVTLRAEEIAATDG